MSDHGFSKQQRVSIFIDVQNMYHTARHLYKGRVDFGAVRKNMIAERNIIRSIAYVVESGLEEEKGFFEALRKAGYEVKSKELQVFAGGQKKADWDVGIAIDMIKLAPKMDVLVLVSGDGDYIPAVEYAQFLGLKVELASFGRSTSSKLIETVDDFTDLDKDYKKYVNKVTRK
ncbi:NYN domain-containing protein [Patescibacteria group bacterium]|nr:NYN domain-containing protein [Patescibacteria group bacterium]